MRRLLWAHEHLKASTSQANKVERNSVCPLFRLYCLFSLSIWIILKHVKCALNTSLKTFLNEIIFFAPRSRTKKLINLLLFMLISTFVNTVFHLGSHPDTIHSTTEKEKKERYLGICKYFSFSLHETLTKAIRIWWRRKCFSKNRRDSLLTLFRACP